MEPAARIAFEYPLYALDLLPDGAIAVAGGGGRMKSGIPNGCVRSVFFTRADLTILPSTAVSLIFFSMSYEHVRKY